jgi:hypothetical protein
MRIAVKETQVFKFEELEDYVKAKVLDKHRDWNLHNDWYEFCEENLKNDLEEIGLRLDKAYFSGFWSQGDGACLEVSLMDLDKLIPKLKQQGTPMREIALARKLGLSFNSKQSGHYYHENSLRFNIDADSYPHKLHEKTWNDLEETVKELVQDLSRDYYRTLEKEYEYLTSDELVKESIEANELEFTKDGSIY